MAQATIGATGGEVVLNSTDGAVFTLSVPAGALPAATAVSISTASATAAQRFTLRFSPQGLVLAAGLSATLTIALQSGQTLPVTGGLLYDGVPISFTRLGDGRFQLLLTNFAGAASAVSARRGQAVRASILADTSGAVCSPQLGGEGGSLTAEDAIDIELYGQCMVATVNALAQNGQYSAAVRVASAVAGFLQASGSGDPRGFIAQASSIACIAYRAALDHAIDTPVTTTLDVLFELARPIMFWEMVRQRLGAHCAQVGIAEYQGVIGDKTTQAVAFFSSKKGAITDTTGTEYTEAVKAARTEHETVTQVRSLQPSPDVNTVLTTQFEQRAQTSLLDAMLEAPWRRCRDTGNSDELIRLMELMDKPAAVATAAQYCGTQLSVQAKDNAGAVTAVLTPSLGGITVDVRNIAGALQARRDGSLSLTGPINALQCPLNSSGGAEVLVIKIDGTTLQTIATAPYLAPTLELGLQAALAAAAVATNATQAVLTVERVGQPCGGYWGNNPAPLLSITLSLATPLTVSNVTLTGSYCGVFENLPFPLSIDASSCTFSPATLSSQIRLELSDANTVTLSNEFSATVSASSLNTGLLFDVTFASAGSVTLTANPQWIQTALPCNSSHSFYNNAAHGPDASDYVGLNICGGSASNLIESSHTFNVTAGQTVHFQSYQSVAGPTSPVTSMSGSGVAATVHFTPAP
jgi:hypothetical protein